MSREKLRSVNHGTFGNFRFGILIARERDGAFRSLQQRAFVTLFRICVSVKIASGNRRKIFEKSLFTKEMGNGHQKPVGYSRIRRLDAVQVVD